MSMNTEDHNELYDHRQHQDSLSVPNNGANAAINNNSTENVQNVPGASVAAPLASDAPATSPLSLLGVSRGRGVRTTQSNSSSTVPMASSGARASRLAQTVSNHRTSFDKTEFGSKPKFKNTKKSKALHSRRGSRSYSISENITKLKEDLTSSANASRPPNQSADSANAPNQQRSRANSTASQNTNSNKLNLTRSISHLNTGNNTGKQQQRRASFDSDDSQASRDSMETEEDVCFPIEPQYHIRVNGIHFGELEDFAETTNEQRSHYIEPANMQGAYESSPAFRNGGTSSSTSTTISSAALKYTPPKQTIEKIGSHTSKNYFNPQPGISFGSNKIEQEDQHDTYEKEHYQNNGQYEQQQSLYTPMEPPFYVPNRFSFFSSESEETVHATDIPSLLKPGQHFSELFRDGEPTWWLDCSCPTDDEMKCITKAFGIHPLTAEDIRMQETREKVELFKSYYFVCFHTFENDHESEDFLEPINVYIVVFRSGVLTFHFNPISHCASVRRRVRQLRDYVNVSSDWICYALIDDITDSFAPVIQSLEYEADSIEDSVFMARDLDFARMLQRIGESRRKTMTLMRLLSGKADVIKMFAKRCQDEANGIGPALTSQINIANLQAAGINHSNKDTMLQQTTQPRGDIALYLGDIQDHLLTMYQNLLAYEKIFSRSHTNYLAQLQVESFNSNNKVTEMLGKVTMLGTMLVPLNIIPGLFGMNVRVPGGDGVGSFGWFFGILSVMVLLALSAWFGASFWIKRIDPPTTLNEAAESGAKSVISSFLPKNTRNNEGKKVPAASKFNPLHRQYPGLPPSNHSVASLPSKYSRYD